MTWNWINLDLLITTIALSQVCKFMDAVIIFQLCFLTIDYNYVQHMNVEGQRFVWKNEVSSLNEISFVWIAKFTALQQVAINVSMFSNTECTLISTSYNVTLQKKHIIFSDIVTLCFKHSLDFWIKECNWESVTGRRSNLRPSIDHLAIVYLL